MGRAARWLRSLWGGRSKEHREHSTCSGGEERTTAERKRWSFRKSRNSEEAATSSAAQNASTAAAIEAAWFRSFYAESEKEQSKHAIAVAAATAAAADAAVAAAEAAVAVVRLTSGGAAAAMFVGYQEQLQLAAVKVQTAFRAYLARKALRALKALVKLQALVRGYLVRKQAAATLHSMQALVRAQATVRAQRSRNLLLDDAIFLPEIHHRRSLGRIDDARSRRPSSHQTRRFSASIDSVIHSRHTDVDEIIDACRIKLRSSRRTSYSAMDSADDDASYHAFSSPLPSQIPARISIPSRRNFQENECCCINVAADKYRLPATAHSTPRCMNSSAGTPAKSLCVAEGVFRMCSSVSNSPNYMANTQSYKAKLRSSQATTTIKRQPLGEINLGGIGIMQKSFSQVEEAFNFKRAVVEKLDRSSDAQKEAYLQRMW